MSIVESKDILELEKFIQDMQAHKPQEWVYEGYTLELKLRRLRVQTMKRILVDYEKQNPKKFNEVKTQGSLPGAASVPTKKEALQKKLKDLEADLKAWEKQKEIEEEVLEPESNQN